MNMASQQPEEETGLSLHPQGAARPFYKRKPFFISVAVLIVALATSLTFWWAGSGTKQAAQPSATEEQKTKSLEETAYTGVTADVLTNQTFECKPRNDHEWYRTDHTLVVDHKDPNTMYVNVEYKGIFKTTDGGKTWVQKTKGIKVYARADDKTKGCYSEYPVLRMDPTNNKRLIIGLSGPGGGFLDATAPNAQVGGVYQTTDGGENWKLMINNRMNVYVTDVAIDPVDPQTVYYGTASNPASFGEADQNKLFVTTGLIYKTTDSGKKWQELPTGIGQRTGAMRVFVNPANTKEIVAPTYSAQRTSADGTGTGESTTKDTSVVSQMGILKSADGGASWSKAQLPGNPAISAAFVAPTNFNHMFFVPQVSGGRANGFASLDGGVTFKQTNAIDLASYDPHDPSGNTVYGYSTTAGTPTRPSLNLFKSVDAGVTWKAYGKLPAEIKDLNDPKVRPSAIVWHPTEKDIFYMSGAGGHIWKTTDRGQTWATLLDYTMLPE